MVSREQPTDELRVAFDHPPAMHTTSIDGTWRRACILMDVSESEATLEIDGSVEGSNLSEFFLLLSSMGLAYRRFELDWVKGLQLGVKFLRRRRGEHKEKNEPSELL